MQILVAIDETNGGELFQRCASANMAIYAVEMALLEVNGSLVHYSQVALNCSVRMISSINMRLIELPLIHPVS